MKSSIGGEIRPEAGGKVFDAQTGNSNIQDFRKCVDQTHVSWLMGLLPGDIACEWKDQVDLRDVPNGKYTLAVRVPNPLPNGLPLRLANATQDRDIDGWLSLTTFVR